MSGSSYEKLVQLLRGRVEGRMTWASGLCVLVVVLFLVSWDTVVRLLLYLLASLAVLLSAACGFLSWHESVPRYRNTWICICVMLLIVGWVLWSVVPASRPQQVAGSSDVTIPEPEAPVAISSIRYWGSLHKTIADIHSFDEKLEASPPTDLEAMKENLVLTTATYNAYAGEILQLPVIDVDPAIVQFARDYVQLLRESAALSGELRDWAKEFQAMTQYAISPALALDIIGGALLGDPLGKVDELQEHGELLDKKKQDLVSRSQELKDRESALGSAELALRSELSRKYGVEFKQIRID